MIMLRRHPERSAGFTLLEVLVAVAVYAVFALLAYAGLMRMLEGRDRVEAEREKWRTLTLAFAQMEDDLAQAHARGVRDAGGATLPAFRGQPVDTRALGDPSVEFTRAGMFLPDEGVASDLRRVAYRFKEGTLLRLTWPTLDRPPTGEPRAVQLLSNADNVTFRFHAANGGWSDRWPITEEKNVLPDAVEFAFDIASVGRVTRVFLVAQ